MNDVQGPMVEVLYSCMGCGLKKRPVTVPERPTVQPVGEWINEMVMRYVGLDHMAMSPLCTHPKADLMLPYADHIGQARRQ